MTQRHRVRVLLVLVLLSVVAWVTRDEPQVEALDPSGSSAPPAGVRAPVRTSSGGFAQRNPFQVLRQHPPPQPPPVQPAAPTKAPPPPQVGPSSLPMTLVGTIASGAYGAAFVLPKKAGLGVRYLALGADLGDLLGDKWRGIRLVEVQRMQARFEGSGRTYVLEEGTAAGDDEGPGPAAAAPVSPPAPSPVPADPSSQDGDGKTEVTLARADVESRLRNLAFLLTQLTVQPYFDEGKPAGIRLSRIRPGSFVSKIGARNGDVLKKVNGKEVEGPRDAFHLYKSLKGQDTTRVEVLRGGRPHLIEYKVE